MTVSILPLQFGIPGGPELLIILLIAVLLFGANKIPKLARSTGEAMGEFQKGREEVEQELQEMREGVEEPMSELDETEASAGATEAAQTTDGVSETAGESGDQIETETGTGTETQSETDGSEFEIADADEKTE